MSYNCYADDFTREHPILVGEKVGTTLLERLERVRDNTKRQHIRKAAERWIEVVTCGDK